MKRLTMSARNVGSGSMTSNAFPYEWTLNDLEGVVKNGLKVFSCFSCGGGSTMGYKLAGYQVIGNNEIDPAMNKLYQANHNPRYNFLCDIRDMISDDNLPDELYNLDILDGSPPCSVFSMAGKREDGWGTEKQFREGQKEQRLDDLFFSFIRLAKKLQPRIVVAENVKGLVIGKSRGYMAEIIKDLANAGYTVQVFLLNAALMGVPQARERVFVIGSRKDLNLPKLELKFNEKPILFGSIRADAGVPPDENTKAFEVMKNRRRGDKTVGDVNKRIVGKDSGFTNAIIKDEQVAPTIASGGSYFRMYDGHKLAKSDFIKVQSFPADYDFLDQSPQYVCGMSVPPVMMAQIANQIYKQWLQGG